MDTCWGPFEIEISFIHFVIWRSVNFTLSASHRKWMAFELDLLLNRHVFDNLTPFRLNSFHRIKTAKAQINSIFSAFSSKLISCLYSKNRIQVLLQWVNWPPNRNKYVKRNKFCSKIKFSSILVRIQWNLIETFWFFFFCTIEKIHHRNVISYIK